MSCTENSRINYNTHFYKMYKLNKMIGNLYVKFYKNNLMDSSKPNLFLFNFISCTDECRLMHVIMY